MQPEEVSFQCAFSLSTFNCVITLAALNDQSPVLTWFPGSELLAEIKAKTKTSTPCCSPGLGITTPAVRCTVS